MIEGPAKTFFCYAREDGAFALRLVKDLRGAGAAVWLDQLDISPGKHWDSEVERALGQCSRMALVLSPDAVNSPNVVDEFSYALGEGKLVIPLLYKDCSIPFRLRRVQHIDFRGDYNTALTDLLKALGFASTSNAVSSVGPVTSRPPRTEMPPETHHVHDASKQSRRLSSFTAQIEAPERARAENEKRKVGIGLFLLCAFIVLVIILPIIWLLSK